MKRQENQPFVTAVLPQSYASILIDFFAFDKMIDLEEVIGGAGEDRTRDLLTASFQPNIDFIEVKRLTPGTERHRALKFCNFRNPDATSCPPGGRV